MLCLLIAHGIFLRQEASQSRRAIMKRVPDLQRPTWCMLDQSQSGTRLTPAPSRVCEAITHRRRVRLKLRPARACTEPPGQLVSFLTTTTARCRLPYLAHFPLRTSLASRHPHEHRTASSLSLVLCNISSFHCTRASRHSFRHPSLPNLPFFVPGDLDTTDASTTVLFYHRSLLVSSHTIPFTSPPGCWTPVLDTALISSLPTTSSSSRLSFGPNYRCLRILNDNIRQAD